MGMLGNYYNEDKDHETLETTTALTPAALPQKPDSASTATLQPEISEDWQNHILMAARMLDNIPPLPRRMDCTKRYLEEIMKSAISTPDVPPLSFGCIDVYEKELPPGVDYRIYDGAGNLMFESIAGELLNRIGSKFAVYRPGHLIVDTSCA